MGYDFYRQLDTLILTNLDSNVLINVRKCEPRDSIFPICIYKDSSFALGNMFNGRTTISRSFLIAPPHFIDTSNYTKGLGLTYYNHIYTPSGGGYNSTELLNL